MPGHRRPATVIPNWKHAGIYRTLQEQEAASYGNRRDEKNEE